MVVYSRSNPLICLTFSTNLKGVALDWFYSLSPRSPHNFEEVTEAFLTQYVFCRETKRNNHHLLTVKIRQSDSTNLTLATSRANWPRSPTMVRTSLHSHSQQNASLSPVVQTSFEAQCYSDEREVLSRAEPYIKLEEATKTSSNTYAKPGDH